LTCNRKKNKKTERKYTQKKVLKNTNLVLSQDFAVPLNSSLRFKRKTKPKRKGKENIKFTKLSGHFLLYKKLRKEKSTHKKK